MKNRILLLFVLMGLATFGFAQTSSENSNFKFGPKFGIDFNANYNNLDGIIDNAQEALSKGYQFGGFVQFGNKVYLQPEFYYSFIRVSETENLESFRIPVHVGIKLLDIGLVSLHLSGGALWEQPTDASFALKIDDLKYQLGVGVNILGFITTDLRYTFNKNETFSTQITNFAEKGGLVNFTVGLRL